MRAWRQQWMRMEQHITQEALRAQLDFEHWTPNVTFSRDYLEGLADGLRRATLMIEAFRKRMPRIELDQRLDDLYDLSEE